MLIKKTWMQPEISFIDLLSTEDPGKSIPSSNEGGIYHT
jgi:hypothetical protein